MPLIPLSHRSVNETRIPFCVGSDLLGWIECEECRGVGTTLAGQACPACGTNGFLRCNSCDGAGAFRITEETCAFCHGYKFVTCPTCDGQMFWTKGADEIEVCPNEDCVEGEVPCQACRHQGYMKTRTEINNVKPRPSRVTAEERAKTLERERQQAEERARKEALRKQQQDEQRRKDDEERVRREKQRKREAEEQRKRQAEEQRQQQLAAAQRRRQALVMTTLSVLIFLVFLGLYLLI
jgi:hypothetical protein